MTVTWTLTDAAGGALGPTPKPTGTLALNYDAASNAYYGTETTAVATAEAECTAAGDSVKINFTQRPGNSEELDKSSTSESKDPRTLPDASWNPNTGAAVTLDYGTTGAGTWTHEFNTITEPASIGLNLKTKVTRPTQ